MRVGLKVIRLHPSGTKFRIVKFAVYRRIGLRLLLANKLPHIKRMQSEAAELRRGCGRY
jgi:hypothetical protein